MYQIGQTSKITKISTRMLRYYDTENILNPSLIQDNGYRCYSDTDISKIIKIKQLRKYHFSYSEIKEILLNNKENDQTIYLEKLKELKSTVANYDLLISELEHLHNAYSAPKIFNAYNVSLLERQNFKALCKRSIIAEDELDSFINHLSTRISKSNISLLGNYFIIFHTIPDSLDAMLEVEYCQPIVDDLPLKGLDLKSFDAKRYMTTLHYGSYDTLHIAYSYLYHWAHHHQLKICGSFEEKYYVDSYFTPSPEEFITEICVEVQ